MMGGVQYTISCPPVPQKKDREFLLRPERRRQLNWDLRLLPVGLAIATNLPPHPQRPHLTIVKVPRGTAGRPPRRGVQIPVATIMPMRQTRVGKHAKQVNRNGCFGKKGFETVTRKNGFLKETADWANDNALMRRLDRQARQSQGGVA